MFGVMAQEQCAESVLLIHHEDSKKDHNMSFLSSLWTNNKLGALTFFSFSGAILNEGAHFEYEQ